MKPYVIEGPAQICFSGGRTSAFMLHQILAANEGLPPDCHVTFENTGKERPQTLDFIEECALRWSVPVHWLEWDGFLEGEPQSRPCFREVNFHNAARHGEPFAAMINASTMLPNPVKRMCTINLKIRTGSAFMRSLGFREWDSVMGIRADEPLRVARMRDPARDNTSGVPLLPLATADVSKRDILDFWKRQPFDLALDPQGDLGNCDLCFLKARYKLVRALINEPERAVWWIEQETKRSGTFRKDPPHYRDLLRAADFYRRQLSLAFEEEDGDSSVTDCYCGD
ncbi:hypothetical protein BG60_29030 [Caballeronia zhejiangensis]|uniref:Nin-like protein n=1 Tax=Caballeronia zhejiangensis TaxID=871203 RepID=A0A656QLU0_9BURK|nr:hypothetical protein BG60_29030 [Caballeronia zhejiangensis]